MTGDTGQSGDWGVRLSFRAENRSGEREKAELRENSRIGHTSDHRNICNSSHSHSKYPSITLTCYNIQERKLQPCGYTTLLRYIKQSM